MTTALIMAGGKGTRLDLDYEKPMVKVNTKPMISYVKKHYPFQHILIRYWWL